MKCENIKTLKGEHNPDGHELDALLRALSDEVKAKVDKVIAEPGEHMRDYRIALTDVAMLLRRASIIASRVKYAPKESV